MIKSIDYGITVTIRPKWYKMLPEDQFDLTVAEITGKLNGYQCKYTLIAEFTKSYNIHFHGILHFTEKQKDYIRLLYDIFRNSRYVGFIMVKPVDNYNEWIEYITKDIKETYKTLICRHPVIRNDYMIDYHLGSLCSPET